MLFSLKTSESTYDTEGQGSYIFFFQHNSKKLAVDATVDEGTLGRLINHSSDAPNLAVKIIVVDRQPVIVFIALEAIRAGQEIQYHYNEKRKAVLKNNPWLR